MHTGGSKVKNQAQYFHKKFIRDQPHLLKFIDRNQLNKRYLKLKAKNTDIKSNKYTDKCLKNTEPVVLGKKLQLASSKINTEQYNKYAVYNQTLISNSLNDKRVSPNSRQYFPITNTSEIHNSSGKQI